MTRIALAGKGGVGKTTLAAGLARLAARAGATVLAIDADSNPNLAEALGVPGGELDVARQALSPHLVSRRRTGPALTEPMERVLEAHGVTAPEGVRLVAMGAPAHAQEGCLCSAHATVSAMLADVADDVVVIVDLEASPEHMSRGTARHVDVLLLVTEPYYRALEAARRLAQLAADLPIPRVGVLANKVRTAEDDAAIREFCTRHGLDLVAAVPYDPEVAVADRSNVSALDAPAAVALPPALERLLAAVAPAQAPGRRSTAPR